MIEWDLQIINITMYNKIIINELKKWFKLYFNRKLQLLWGIKMKDVIFHPFFFYVFDSNALYPIHECND